MNPLLGPLVAFSTPSVATDDGAALFMLAQREIEAKKKERLTKTLFAIGLVAGAAWFFGKKKRRR